MSQFKIKFLHEGKNKNEIKIKIKVEVISKKRNCESNDLKSSTSMVIFKFYKYEKLNFEKRCGKFFKKDVVTLLKI